MSAALAPAKPARARLRLCAIRKGSSGLFPASWGLKRRIEHTCLFSLALAAMHPVRTLPAASKSCAGLRGRGSFPPLRRVGSPRSSSALPLSRRVRRNGVTQEVGDGSPAASTRAQVESPSLRGESQGSPVPLGGTSGAGEDDRVTGQYVRAFKRYSTSGRGEQDRDETPGRVPSPLLGASIHPQDRGPSMLWSGIYFTLSR